MDAEIEAARIELRWLGVALNVAATPGKPGWLRLSENWWHQDYPAPGLLTALRLIPWPQPEPEPRRPLGPGDVFWAKGGLYALLACINGPPVRTVHTWALDMLAEHGGPRR